MAAGKGFWGKLGTSMKNVTPEQWRAGAIITDKFSGGATGYLGTSLAGVTSLDGKINLKSDRGQSANSEDSSVVKTGAPKVNKRSNFAEEYPNS